MPWTVRAWHRCLAGSCPGEEPSKACNGAWDTVWQTRRCPPAAGVRSAEDLQASALPAGLSCRGWALRLCPSRGTRRIKAPPFPRAGDTLRGSICSRPSL